MAAARRDGRGAPLRAAQAIVLPWKTLGIIPVSLSDLAAAAPAVLTVVALVVVARRFRQPAALASPSYEEVEHPTVGSPEDDRPQDEVTTQRRDSAMSKLIILLARRWRRSSTRLTVAASRGAPVRRARPRDDASRCAVAPSADNDLAFTQSMLTRSSTCRRTTASTTSRLGEHVRRRGRGHGIRDYADQGYDLVIAHGSQYGGSLEQLAPHYPETSFAWGTAGDTFGLPNVYAYTARPTRAATSTAPWRR